MAVIYSPVTLLDPGSRQRRWEGSSPGQRLSKPHAPLRTLLPNLQLFNSKLLTSQDWPVPLNSLTQLSACCCPSLLQVLPRQTLLKPSCQCPAPCSSQGFIPSLPQTLLGSPSPLCLTNRPISAWGVILDPLLHCHSNHQVVSLSHPFSIHKLQEEVPEGPLNYKSSDKGVWPPPGCIHTTFALSHASDSGELLHELGNRPRA